MHVNYNKVYACFAVKVFENRPLKYFKQGGSRPVRRRWIRLWSRYFRNFTMLLASSLHESHEPQCLHEKQFWLINKREQAFCISALKFREVTQMPCLQLCQLSGLWITKTLSSNDDSQILSLSLSLSLSHLLVFRVSVGRKIPHSEAAMFSFIWLKDTVSIFFCNRSNILSLCVSTLQSVYLNWKKKFV